jgi:hypothetical protein
VENALIFKAKSANVTFIGDILVTQKAVLKDVFTP